MNTDAQIMSEWFLHGGAVHGPNVETVTMPQADYLKFRRSLSEVTDADVYFACRIMYGERWLTMDQESPKRLMRETLKALKALTKTKK